MQQLLADELKKDPRIIKAKELFLEAIADHQNKLSGVCPPIKEKEITYKEAIKEFEEDRGNPLWYPYLGSGIGRGALVELADGSVKYDLISGIGAHFGHSHPKLLAAAFDAALCDVIMQGNLQQNRESAELAELILAQTKLDHIFFASSGAMACENALKLIFQKHFPARRLLAFDHCFMGRTLALSQITDKASFREGLPINLDVDYLPFYDPDKPVESIECALKCLKNYLERYPRGYAALCVELVQGEGGFHVGRRDFFCALFEEARKNEIAIFVDEVQTFGRTSHLFAYQHFDLDEYVDVVTIGKISQVCATLFRHSYNPKPGLLSQTFTSSSSAIHASLAIIKCLLEDGFLGNEGKIAKLHEEFVRRLKHLSIKYPHLIKGPYGIGSMICFTPFEGKRDKVIQFTQNLFRAGIISFIAGSEPAKVRFLLPTGGLKEDEIASIFSILEAEICPNHIDRF